MMRKMTTGLLLLFIAMLLISCGEGTSSTNGDGEAPLPSLVLALTDAGNVPTTTLAADALGKLTLTLRNAAGHPVANALATFTTNDTYGSFTPASGTKLTDSQGVATMVLNAGNVGGAATINVTATWQENGQEFSATTAINYQISTSASVPLTISDPEFGVSPLSAYGTTSVTVEVTGSEEPLSVSFTSTCAADNKATITAEVTTSGGFATANYRDYGCARIDTITATVNADITSSSQLTVMQPNAGSIRFISADPTNISLKGTGGAGRQESSEVKFMVADTAGNPLQATVNFSLSTSVGGITLAPTSAVTNGASGEVTTVINAGTVSTPVRVTATVAGTSISTQSDELTISTGIPVQTHLSPSVGTLNIEGWRFDGVTTDITVRLADHFSNPVPDGTAVSLIAEGGRIDSNCLTSNSECSVTFTSQELRPANGRVTVLVYAIGNESFTDLNGNGTVDGAWEMIDANGISTDLGEAFIDYNENGVRDPNEPFIDFGGLGAAPTIPDGIYNGPDGLYNGILCTPNAAICSEQTSTHIFRNLVIVLSDSEAVAADVFANAPIDLGGCGTPGNSFSFDLVLQDLNGHPLPAGTSITVATTNGTIDSGASQVVPNSTTATLFPLTIRNDASGTPCSDPTPTGILTVTTTTTKGVQTSYQRVLIN